MEIVQGMWRVEVCLDGFESVISVSSDWVMEHTFYPHSIHSMGLQRVRSHKDIIIVSYFNIRLKKMFVDLYLLE